MSEPLDLTSQATIQRRKTEVMNSQGELKVLRKQAEDINRRAAWIENKAASLEDQADEYNVKGYDLKVETLPQLKGQAEELRLNIWQAENQDQQFIALQEFYQSQAQARVRDERKQREEAGKKWAEARIRRSLSGQAGMFGLNNDQMGWHSKARPYNQTAAELGEEAAKLEMKANADEQKANSYLVERTVLMDEKRRLDDQRSQLQLDVRAWRKSLAIVRRQTMDTHKSITVLKDEEGKLRTKEWALSNKHDDLSDEAKQVEAKAEELQLEIIALEKLIPDAWHLIANQYYPNGQPV